MALLRCAALARWKSGAVGGDRNSAPGTTARSPARGRCQARIRQSISRHWLPLGFGPAKFQCQSPADP